MAIYNFTDNSGKALAARIRKEIDQSGGGTSEIEDLKRDIEELKAQISANTKVWQIMVSSTSNPPTAFSHTATLLNGDSWKNVKLGDIVVVRGDPNYPQPYSFGEELEIEMDDFYLTFSSPYLQGKDYEDTYLGKESFFIGVVDRDKNWRGDFCISIAVMGAKTKDIHWI